MADDRQLREFTCDPKQRKVLVTDGKTALGQALAKSFAKAGAEIIWVGHAEPWKKFAGFDELQKPPAGDAAAASMSPTRRTCARPPRRSRARSTSSSTTPSYHRSFGIANRQGVETARAEMDVNYFGLLRLAQEFGPAMRSRGADGKASAVAWVNLLSIYAHANFPPHGTFSASKAAAHSLAQCLRAEMRPAGRASGQRISRADRRRVEPAPAAAEACARNAGQGGRRRAARGHRGRLPGRRGAGMARPLAR